MQAIQTKYLPMTNTRLSRIKATAAAGTITVSYDHSLDVEGNHRAACDALRAKLSWVGDYYADMVGGQLPDGSYAWVFAGETPERMWINQPSSLQIYHPLHGTNVLAYREYDDTYRVYFLSGPVISQQVTGDALSKGWK